LENNDSSASLTCVWVTVTITGPKDLTLISQ